MIVPAEGGPSNKEAGTFSFIWIGSVGFKQGQPVPSGRACTMSLHPKIFSGRDRRKALLQPRVVLNVVNICSRVVAWSVLFCCRQTGM